MNVTPLSRTVRNQVGYWFLGVSKGIQHVPILKEDMHHELQETFQMSKPKGRKKPLLTRENRKDCLEIAFFRLPWLPFKGYQGEHDFRNPENRNSLPKDLRSPTSKARKLRQLGIGDVLWEAGDRHGHALRKPEALLWIIALFVLYVFVHRRRPPSCDARPKNFWLEMTCVWTLVHARSRI